MFKDSEIKYIEANNQTLNSLPLLHANSEQSQPQNQNDSQNQNQNLISSNNPDLNPVNEDSGLEYRVDIAPASSNAYNYRSVDELAKSNDLISTQSIIVEGKLMRDIQSNKLPTDSVFLDEGRLPLASSVVKNNIEGDESDGDDVVTVGSAPGLIGAKLRRNLRQLGKKRVIAISRNAKSLLKSLTRAPNALSKKPNIVDANSKSRQITADIAKAVAAKQLHNSTLLTASSFKPNNSVKKAYK